MAAITFSALPPEIHVAVAEYCEKKDLINLCLTSKWVKERCLPVLYRHLDMPLDVKNFEKEPSHVRNKPWELVRTLLSHPEYGKHVRFLNTTLCIPSCFDRRHQRRVRLSDEDFWRAMQSLTHVQTLLLSFTKLGSIDCRMVPNSLFQSATSVRLVGEIHFDLARSILNAINPKLLKYLCLEFVLWPCRGFFPVNGTPPGEDGGTMTLGATSVLLTMLTGRCTALRTLILRRVGYCSEDNFEWRMAEEETSYIDWGSFIRSVHGTVEKFMFEQAASWPFRGGRFEEWRHDITDERFDRHILPAIVSGTWPCLAMMHIRGVRNLDSQGGKDTLMMELRSVLGENPQILLEAGSRV